MTGTCEICDEQLEQPAKAGRPRKYCSPSCRQEGFVRRRIEKKTSELRMILLDWFYDMDGIADEMTWFDSQANGQRYKDLMALEIEPYDDETREAWREWRKTR